MRIVNLVIRAFFILFFAFVVVFGCAGSHTQRAPDPLTVWDVVSPIQPDEEEDEEEEQEDKLVFATEIEGRTVSVLVFEKNRIRGNLIIQYSCTFAETRGHDVYELTFRTMHEGRIAYVTVTFIEETHDGEVFPYFGDVFMRDSLDSDNHLVDFDGVSEETQAIWFEVVDEGTRLRRAFGLDRRLQEAKEGGTQ